MKAHRLFVLALSLVFSLGLAQTQLTVFIGGQQRPDVIGPILERFSAENPDIDAGYEVGGATSEAQQQYLSTVLTSQSGDIDIFLIDVVRPAQYAASGWAEPLNPYFESEAAMMDYLEAFLPGPVEAGMIDGTLYALPAFTDAQFLYYRADLLERYGLEPPTTWEELMAQAQTITEGEGDPNLQGFNYQGAAIEGTVCTFLEALWTAGGDWRDEAGNITIDSPEGRRALEWYQSTIESGITVPGIAEMTTDLSRQQFQAGNVVFMLNWGYAWAHFQGDSPDATEVAGVVGVAPLPAFEGGESATCVGGWQWAINPYSQNKEAAFTLLQFLAGEDAQRTLAVQASNIPARQSLYQDPEVLEAAPHFAEFYEVIVGARSRPVTAFYTEVSELIRTTMNAFFAQAIAADEALSEMQLGLEDILEN
ncbi:ABC transporter substrate-binding protein [soil metagenome]